MMYTGYVTTAYLAAAGMMLCLFAVSLYHYLAIKKALRKTGLARKHGRKPHKKPSTRI